MAGNETTVAGTPASPAPSAIQFSCPACGGQLEVRAPGITISVYCTHCGSELDAVNNENVRLLQKSSEALQITPQLTLGQRGRLQGIDWDIIGFMQRSCGGYRWSEYLLFNPKNGFRWLVENQGHWTLYRNIKHKVEVSESFTGKSSAKLQNKNYKLFDSSSVNVDYVLGEFYWRVRKGDTSQIDDYICPPFLLSHETAEGGKQAESLWSLGEYIPYSDIAAAFQSSRRIVWPIGAGANQPNKYSGSAKEMTFYAVIFSAILCALTFVSGIGKNEIPHTLVTQKFQGAGSSGTVTGQLSKSFTVEQDRTRLDFIMTSNVDNSWAELAIDLVNEDTGQIIQLEQGNEVWRGQDSDGPWMEGNSYSERKLVRVPAGSYHLDADFQWSGLPPNATAEATLAITTGKHSSLLFWLGLILLYLPALISAMASSSFETQRWSNSPYNPYEA